MASRFNVKYLDIEQGLFVLRSHFDMCRGAENQDVVHWAKFLKSWAGKATPDTGAWCQDLLVDIERLLRELEKNKKGDAGFGLLQDLMAKASRDLDREILDSLPQGHKVPAQV